ncbi:MAG: deoxyribose-phosphate aldolase [Solirubrobacteraceae bacterium]|nr:deoxyribose-phosphate aldolase [Solirubrobacteraceae bacterium]
MSAADLRRALSVVDLTRLERPDDAAAIDALAAKAVTDAGRVAAICVYPEWIERVLGPGVPVAAVANFPAGADDADLAAREAAQGVGAGATEIDVVVPWRTFAAGDGDAIARVVSATRAAIGPGIGLKAILETGSLESAARVRAAGEQALAAGADFLKTSTGKVGAGASLAATRVLLEVVRDAGHGGVKASGGVRTAERATEYLALADEVMGAGWATPERFRIGASSLVDDLLGRLGEDS